MTRTLLALGAAAVALSAAPADAQYRHHARVCAKWRHGHCVRWANRGTMRATRYRVGYRFGPNYGYTAYSALPPTYVRRYRLNRDDRYVYSNGNIYVVDPTTYAVTRVLNALAR